MSRQDNVDSLFPPDHRARAPGPRRPAGFRAAATRGAGRRRAERRRRELTNHRMSRVPVHATIATLGCCRISAGQRNTVTFWIFLSGVRLLGHRCKSGPKFYGEGVRPWVSAWKRSTHWTAAGGMDQAPRALPDSLLPGYRAAVEDLVRRRAATRDRPTCLTSRDSSPGAWGSRRSPRCFRTSTEGRMPPPSASSASSATTSPVRAARRATCRRSSGFCCFPRSIRCGGAGRPPSPPTLTC